MFHVGQLVLCVDDRPSSILGVPPPPGWYLEPLLDGLTRGVVYTVRRVGLHHADNMPLVWLEEIVRPRFQEEFEEPGYLTIRFRPLKDESFSVFRQALEPSPKQTEAA